MNEAAKIKTLKDDEKAQWEKDFESIEGGDTTPLWERKLRMDRARMIDDIEREFAQQLQDAARLHEDSLFRAREWFREEMAKRAAGQGE